MTSEIDSKQSEVPNGGADTTATMPSATENSKTVDSETNARVSSDDLPSPDSCHKVENYTVLDRKGEAHPFKSLYDGPDSASREFLTALTNSIRPEDLKRLPVSTSISIVGCGDPGLINFYATETGCPFPIFADPTRKLYDDLGMVNTLSMGTRPDYIRKSLVRTVAESIGQALKHIPSGLGTKGGDSRQVGGEFLFEPSDEGEGKQVTWCYRMKTTRDHTGVSELVKVLDPDGSTLLQKA
ncbi:hypothetical protein N7510_010818 [Penicillium lagena]|uniref:uncharacterized protein n=1 Tax=Penicillium lagena TaxID=94218 RepID=UPI00253FC1ED|nr:uncharacterized protein N7510_010818 [Penicillium lagena]KAJ5601284.1 hypothetical protein N7510_010818 [Penicillium lagena]